MARQESDREDIMREATALVDRAELELPGQCEPLIVGFRRDGSLSLFFGPDEVYQFNAQSCFRRGFLAGRLLKAEQGKIVELVRRRTADEVQLIRNEFSDVETREYVERLQRRLDDLRNDLTENRFVLRGEVRSNTTNAVVDLVLNWFETVSLDAIKIANHPRVGRP